MVTCGKRCHFIILFIICQGHKRYKGHRKVMHLKKRRHKCYTSSRFPEELIRLPKSVIIYFPGHRETREMDLPDSSGFILIRHLVGFSGQPRVA